MVKNLTLIDNNYQLPELAQGRLTLTSNTPVLSGNVTGATNIYYTPYKGNQISIYNGSNWEVKTFSELTLSLSGLTTNTVYDVFIYDNNDTLTLESVAWSNSGAGTSTRATALSWLNGIRVKSSDNRKYLGSFIINATGGQIDFVSGVEGTASSNGFFNEYNKENLNLNILDNTSHSYTTATYRAWRNLSANSIKVLATSAITIAMRGSISTEGGFIASLDTISEKATNFYAYSSMVGNGSTSNLAVLEGFHLIEAKQIGSSTNTNFNNLFMEVSLEY